MNKHENLEPSVDGKAGKTGNKWSISGKLNWNNDENKMQIVTVQQQQRINSKIQIKLNE